MLRLAAVAAVAVTSLTTACGSADDEVAKPPATSGAPTPTPSATPAEVSVAQMCDRLVQIAQIPIHSDAATWQAADEQLTTIETEGDGDVDALVGGLRPFVASMRLGAGTDGLDALETAEAELADACPGFTPGG